MDILIIMLSSIGIALGIVAISTLFKKPKPPEHTNEHGLPYTYRHWYMKYHNIGFWDKEKKKVVWLLDITAGEIYSQYLQRHEPVTHRKIISGESITTMANQFRDIQQVKEFNDEVKLVQAQQYAKFWSEHWAAEKSYPHYNK